MSSPSDCFVARVFNPCSAPKSRVKNPCHVIAIVACFLLHAEALAQPTTRPTLRVAADPNNLPFSNQKLEGFENRMAQLVADEIGKKLEYAWRAQRRGFFREAFKSDECDL